MPDLLNIELARPGIWHLASGKTTFEVDHLKDAAEFFNATGGQKIPLALGHSDPRFSGDPSFGNVANVRYEEDERGPVLKGDLVDMPEWLHAAAPKRWPNRSIEGFQDFEYDGRKYKLVLTALALLGVSPPGVRNISSLQDLQLALAASAARRIVATAAADYEVDDDGMEEHVLDDDGLECVTCARKATDDAIRAMYSPEQPRVPSGSASGGQFAPSDSGGSGDHPPKKTAPPKKPTSNHAPPKPRAKPKPDIPDGQLGFDGKTGTGYGTPDPRVKDLQTALNRLHLTDDGHRKLRVDGEFGPLTTQAVKKAQQRLGMEPTGIVSPEFVDKLKTLERLPRAKRTRAAGAIGGSDPVTAKFDPHQPRDADGQWSDGVPGNGALDKLKLGTRAPAGYTVRSSKKLKTDYADVGIAEVDSPDGPQIRVGVIGNESGKWDAGFVGEARKTELRQEIARKQALMDSEDDNVDDDIEDQIGELQSELEDLEGERTAIISPEQMAQFRRQLDDGLEVAKANKAKQDATMKALDELDEKRQDFIDEFGNYHLERQISEASSFIPNKRKTIKSLEGDLKNGSPYGWSPEMVAELLGSHRADLAKMEAELAPLLARRAEIMAPDARARLEDLDRQYDELVKEDIDDILASAEVSAPDGTRVVAEIWGSDDVDEQWVSSRLYVLTPGETTDEIDSEYGTFRGLRGLSKLIAGFGEPSADKTVSAAADTHPGGEELKHWWLHGEGAAKWATWTELYHHLRKHINPEMAKRVAAQWFHERYGFWPGADVNRVAHGKKPRGEKVGPG